MKFTLILATILVMLVSSCGPAASSQYNVRIQNKQIAKKYKTMRKNAHRDATGIPVKVAPKHQQKHS